jgi:hypothetical protein
MQPEDVSYEELEELKRMGWIRFAQSSDAGHKAYVLMNYIITAHYWRAREQLETCNNYEICIKKIAGKNYSHGYELDIDHYTEHWLHAQRKAAYMQDGVLEYFIENWYTPNPCKYLPDGCTAYVFL